MSEPQRATPPVLEEDPSIHEYRAALLSVFLNADPRGPLVGAPDPNLQPLPLSQAIDLIHRLPRAQQEDALALADFRLRSALLIENREELRPHLASLLGSTEKELSEQRIGGQLREEIATTRSPPEARRAPRERRRGRVAGITADALRAPDASRGLSYEDVRQFTFGLHPREEQPPGSDETGSAFLTRSARVTRSARAVRRAPGPLPPAAGAKRPLTKKESDELQKKVDADFQQLALSRPDQPESRLNLTTLVTTVDIPSKSNCDFETLARTLDPRSWKSSPFWPESHRVRQSPDGREFTPFEKDDENPALGIGWEGLFFEHVRMNWNTAHVASFRNYLNIKFEVDPVNQLLRLGFSLYWCEGSQIATLTLNRGIDVDRGFQSVARNPLGSDGKPPKLPFRLRTQKNIRYVDFLDRRTPNEGPLGAGQFLAFMAPAIVGLWMNELLRNLHCQT